MIKLEVLKKGSKLIFGNVIIDTKLIDNTNFKLPDESIDKLIAVLNK